VPWQEATVIAHDLFTIGIPLSEKVIRTVAVYIGIAVLIRLGGKRDIAQLNTFDLVVMLLLSNVVQNSIIGNDISLTGGLLGAAVLMLLNSFVVRLAGRSDRAVALFEGTPTTLIKDGKYDAAALRHEGLRKADVDVAIRKQGATGAGEVARAVLEPGGSVVVTMQPSAMPASRGDVETLQAALAAIDAKVSALATS
jgi:uncharacterized membrane protein YcaP (DUF421 family)